MKFWNYFSVLLSQAQVSFKRINKFLMLDEVDKDAIDRNPESGTFKYLTLNEGWEMVFLYLTVYVQ